MDSLKRKHPLVIFGPGGSGKTALIYMVLADLALPSDVLFIPYCSTLHGLLLSVARSLINSRHKTFRTIAKPGADAEKWLSKQTSMHLRGLLWTALEAEPQSIILDGVAKAGFATYRFLQRLYFAKDMALYASARDPLALGALARLFWDPRNTLHLRPLNESDAGYLFDLAVAHFKIGHLDLEDFRRRVLASAKGNPGQLLEMCRLAANPMYTSGTHIKFAPLRIDVLMKFL